MWIYLLRWYHNGVHFALFELKVHIVQHLHPVKGDIDALRLDGVALTSVTS